MQETRRRLLRAALVVVGIGFLLVYPLYQLWPTGWTWQPPQSEYEAMIAAIYAVLGVFLLRAVPRPEAHASLIWFTVWSSLAHGGLMAVQAAVDPAETGHFAGDVLALALVAVFLGVLAPGGLLERREGSTARVPG